MMRNIALAVLLASAGIGGIATPVSAHGGNHDGMSQWEHCRAHHGWFYCVINGRAADVPAGATVAPAAAPPPPPPPPAPACNPGPFLVFFDWDKGDLSPDSSMIVEQAVSAYVNCGGMHVRVVGHADTSQSAQRSEELSKERAKAVADRLGALGIPMNRIQHTGFGESDLRVPTEDGVRAPENRRVEITFGSAPEPEPEPEPGPET